MAINYYDLLTRQEEARSEFGRLLRKWRVANKWTRWDPARLAESEGLHIIHGMIAPASWTDMEKGDCWYPCNFLGLGWLNHQPNIVAIGSAEYQNLLWGPTDFFAFYCGLQTTPWTWRHP